VISFQTFLFVGGGGGGEDLQLFPPSLFTRTFNPPVMRV